MRLSPKVVEGPSIAANWDSTLLKQITCPVLLITAETERGAIVTADDVKSLKEFIPKAEVAHIAGAGHSIHREQFEVFMAEVQAFLNSVTP